MVPILATRKTAFDPPHPFMMKAGASSPVEGGLNPNPILALIANRSSQLFGFLRPVNPAPVASPGFLDLPTILMLQNNILAMLNNNNIRQVGFFRCFTLVIMVILTGTPKILDGHNPNWVKLFYHKELINRNCTDRNFVDNFLQVKTGDLKKRQKHIKDF